MCSATVSSLLVSLPAGASVAKFGVSVIVTGFVGPRFSSSLASSVPTGNKGTSFVILEVSMVDGFMASASVPESFGAGTLVSSGGVVRKDRTEGVNLSLAM